MIETYLVDYFLKQSHEMKAHTVIPQFSWWGEGRNLDLTTSKIQFFVSLLNCMSLSIGDLH